MARLGFLRTYDEAMRTFVRNRVKGRVTYVDESDGSTYEKPVHDYVFLATPDRPYGFDAPFITDPKEGRKIDVERMTAMLQTPRVTITRGDMFEDVSRRNTRPVRIGPFWDKEQTSRVFIKHVNAWNIPYTIDVRAWLRNDAQAVIEWWMLNATLPHVVFKIDFGYPWNEKAISMKVSEIRDLSLYEPGEEFRFVHYQIPLMLEAWGFEGFQYPSDLPSHELDPEALTSRRRVVHAVNVRVFECGAPKTPILEVEVPVVPPADPPEEDFC